MSPYPQPRPASPTPSRNKEPVKFSTLDHPPRANLLPPAALLSLLCLAFLCLVFVCFRHAGWIVKARKKIGKLIQKQTAKLSDYFQEFIYNRHGRIKLIDDDQVEGPTSLSGSRVSLSAERLQPLDLSHHHQLPSQLATVSRLQDDDQEEDDDEEDNEVLPPVRYSKK